MKKIIAVLLVIIMIMSCMATAQAAYFNDVNVSVGSKYVDAINYLSDNGIMSGWPNGDFRPNAEITRAQAVTVLYRLSEDSGTYPAVTFNDVSPYSVYYPAICWAVYSGITNGTTLTTFEPNVGIPRQQLLVMLYRFAGYKGYSQRADHDMSAYSDWLFVGNFARTAVQWAYTYAITDDGTTSSTISPTDVVKRKEMALYSLNYRLNLEGIVRGRDDYCFANNSDCFMSGRSIYLMSEDDWETFENAYETIGVYNSVHTINDLMNLRWQGSCFGLAVALALDCSGKIDLNGNYCNNASCLHDIPTLTDISNAKHQQVTTPALQGSRTISNAESKINFYFLSQYLTPLCYWRHKYSPNDVLPELIEAQMNGGIGILSYVRPNGKAHVINVYGEPIHVGNCYRVPIYNNNNSDCNGYLEIEVVDGNYIGRIYNNSADDRGSATPEVITQCRYQNNFDIFIEYGLDIDDEYNEELAARYMSDSEVMEDYDLICVRAQGDFSIENSSGDSLSINDGVFEDNMSIFAYNFVVFGEGMCEYMFIVPKSESYKCVADNGCLEAFYAADNNQVFGASSNDYFGSISTISIDSNGSVKAS